MRDLDGQLCEISISHDDKFAQAVAIVPRINFALDIGSGDWQPAPRSGELSVQEVYNGFRDPLGDPPKDDTAASPAPEHAPEELRDSESLQALIRERRAALETRKRQLAELDQIRRMEKHLDKNLTARTKQLQDRNNELTRLVRIANLKAKIAESEKVLSGHANSATTQSEHISVADDADVHEESVAPTSSTTR